jgi:hypothetical protein
VVELFIQLNYNKQNSVYIQIFLEGDLHGVKPVRAGLPLLGEKGGRGFIYCTIRGLFLEQSLEVYKQGRGGQPLPPTPHPNSAVYL